MRGEFDVERSLSVCSGSLTTATLGATEKSAARLALLSPACGACFCDTGEGRAAEVSRRELW
jgi:hypothetical protein